VDLRISTNAAQLARRMRDRPAAVRRNLLRVAREMAPRIAELSRGVMRAKIYSVPIPKGKNGRQKWIRTRALLNSEQGEPRGQDILLRNAAPHAVPRRDLGTPQGRPIRSPGVQSVNWQGESREQARAEVLQARREAVQRALQNP
jgi:hypothetical protein